LQRLKVTNVAPDKGAAKAGLQVGDLIETFNGQIIFTNEMLTSALQSAPVGGEMVVHRNNKTLTVFITETPLGITTLAVGFVPPKIEELGVVQPSVAANVIVTTTNSIDGYRISKVRDVVSAECVFGVNIFKEFLTSITDVIGGRSTTSQKVLRDARYVCMREIRTEAFELGANAVVGTSLSYNEISGQGKSMLLLVISGTAVNLEKLPEDCALE
jgi:uncharacterized protein YbjQ (UPF0145 family)